MTDTTIREAMLYADRFARQYWHDLEDTDELTAVYFPDMPWSWGGPFLAQLERMLPGTCIALTAHQDARWQSTPLGHKLTWNLRIGPGAFTPLEGPVEEEEENDD